MITEIRVIIVLADQNQHHLVTRLHPNVPSQARMAAVDVTLPSGYKVYKNELVQFSSYVQARHPAIWGETALVFNPDRWLREDGSVMKVTICPIVTC